MWKDLETGFQAAFAMAWDAYKAGTIPIGAAVLNEAGEMVAAARNQCGAAGSGLISNHQLAHAEINAILMLPEDGHPDIRTYTLYTNTEPCPLCFGAIVMGSIRHVRYAQRDPWAGAAGMNGTIAYLVRKGIIFEGPFAGPERVSATMQMCYEFETRGADWNSAGNYGKFIRMFADTFPVETENGKRFAADKTLRRFADSGAGIGEVYDYVSSLPD